MAQKAKDGLTEEEIQNELQGLRGWSGQGKASISRTLKCRDFLTAMKLVNAVAESAQRLDHHPDMNIQYDKVTFTLTSHDAGGVSRRDLVLAREIDTAAAAHGAGPAKS